VVVPTEDVGPLVDGTVVVAAIVVVVGGGVVGGNTDTSGSVLGGTVVDVLDVLDVLDVPGIVVPGVDVAGAVVGDVVDAGTVVEVDVEVDELVGVVDDEVVVAGSSTMRNTFCLPVPLPKVNTALYWPGGSVIGVMQNAPSSPAVASAVNTSRLPGCVEITSRPLTPATNPTPPIENGFDTRGEFPGSSPVQSTGSETLMVPASPTAAANGAGASFGTAASSASPLQPRATRASAPTTALRSPRLGERGASMIVTSHSFPQ
jgi:hypothetical protein